MATEIVLRQFPVPYIDAGYGFLLAEYRGYSGLPGRPTESGLYADGRAFLNKMISSGVKDTSLILLGLWEPVWPFKWPASSILAD